MTKKVLCPQCGKKTVFKEASVLMPIKVGKGSTDINLHYYDCSECGCSLDLDHSNDSIMKKGLDSAMQNCAHTILEEFSAKKNFSELERLFLLPCHTLSKWKNGSKKPSAAAVMLLRLIDLLPWLEDAAEEKLEPEAVNSIATKYYIERFNNCNRTISYFVSGNHTHTFTASFNFVEESDSQLDSKKYSELGNLKPDPNLFSVPSHGVTYAVN
ncbi:MAG: hypothetical protein M0P01_14345 [Treponema sp.]|nr:hypothetical protein [Treponema sp.]